MEESVNAKKNPKNEQTKNQAKQAGDNKAQKRKGHEQNPQQIKVNI
jgi:hypothetical protein